MVSPSLTSWTSCNGSHLNALFLLPIKILFPCVCVCFFFGCCFLCLCIFVLSAIGFGSGCFRVHRRETVLVPNLKLNHLRILLNPKLCFVLYCIVLNLICFEPSHNNLLEQIATGIQAIMQGLCFWHLSGQHIFWWQEGWILFPIQVWLWLCSLAIWRFCLDASFAEFNTKVIFLHALMQILHECSSCEGLGSSTERVLSRDEKR